MKGTQKHVLCRCMDEDYWWGKRGLGEAAAGLFELDGGGGEAIELGGAVVAFAQVARFFEDIGCQHLAPEIALVEGLVEHRFVNFLQFGKGELGR